MVPSHFLVPFTSGAALHVSGMFDTKTKKLPLANFMSFAYTRNQPGNQKRFSAVAKQTNKQTKAVSRLGCDSVD